MSTNTNHRRTVLMTASIAAGAVAIVVAVVGQHASHASETGTQPGTAPVLRHEGERIVLPQGSPLRASVLVATVNSDPVGVPFTLPAVVEAEPGRVARVQTPLTGRIVSFKHHMGDTVAAGEVLFSVDSPDLAQAGTDAAKADAALILARHNLDRQQALDAADIASKRDVEQARNDMQQAASDAARAAARLAQLGVRTGDVAGPGAGHVLAVRAPISGRVVEMSAGAGGYWNDASAPVLTVADLARVYVTASAQEKDLGQLHEGQEVVLNFDAWPQAVHANVAMLDWMLDPDTRTLKVRILVDNHDGRLRPGMFARASFVAPARHALMVPAAAVVQSGLTARVFVEVAPWQFVPRTVTLGAQTGGRIEVLTGLQAGDRVVVKNGVLLND